MVKQFNEENFHTLCDGLAAKDKSLRSIIEQYGYPPMWTRPNQFETLVLTILEQQISLAAAYAAFQKLKERIAITPENLLLLTDEELRACYFTRQKTVYVRGLAQAILSGQINLQAFETMDDAEVRKQLKALKGIGDWTVDIYMIHVLRRTDIFPLGDLALLNGVRMVKENKELTKEEIEKLSQRWKPYRTIATMLVWHYYIKKKNIRLLH